MRFTEPHPHRNAGWPRMSLISAFFVWWEGVLILSGFGERYREGHLGKTIQRLQRGHASLSHPDHPEGAPCLLHHRWLVLMTLSILFVHQVGNQGESLPWGEWAIGNWEADLNDKNRISLAGNGEETRSRDGCGFIFWLRRHRKEFPLLTHLSFSLPEFCIPCLVNLLWKSEQTDSGKSHTAIIPQEWVFKVLLMYRLKELEKQINYIQKEFKRDLSAWWKRQRWGAVYRCA